MRLEQPPSSKTTGEPNAPAGAMWSWVRIVAEGGEPPPRDDFLRPGAFGNSAVLEPEGAGRQGQNDQPISLDELLQRYPPEHPAGVKQSSTRSTESIYTTELLRFIEL